MVDKLCRHYGTLIGEVDGVNFYDLPSPIALTGPGVEGHLRELGFGYRAKYLARTAELVAGKGDGWLDGLRNPESPIMGQEWAPAGDLVEGGREGYRKAHAELLALQGVGPKVADCVCLMGLGWGEAVPVDTHVWQIAQRDYNFGKGKHSSLTKATYDAVGNRFRSLWGKEAGWAHSVLFTADLRAFAERLVAKTEVIKTTSAVKDEAAGDDDDDNDNEEVQMKVKTVVKEKRVKVEPEEEERKVLEFDEVAVRPRPKRRRRG